MPGRGPRNRWRISAGGVRRRPRRGRSVRAADLRTTLGRERDGERGTCELLWDGEMTCPGQGTAGAPSYLGSLAAHRSPVAQSMAAA